MLRQLEILLVFVIFAKSATADNRELIPLEAPSNLTLIEIKNKQVVIEWDPVDPSKVRGNFRGYLVRTWNHLGSQVYAFGPEVTQANVEFFPFSKNFITVAVKNEKYVGKPSEAISFDAPQIEPSPPPLLKVSQLSNTSILVQWAQPSQTNGLLLGYKIYCFQGNNTKSAQVSQDVNDPQKLQAKLSGLREGIEYRVEVGSVNCAGESMERQHDNIILAKHVEMEPVPAKLFYKIGYNQIDKDQVCYDIGEEIEEPAEEKEYDYYDFIFGNIEKKKNATTVQPNVDKKLTKKNCTVNCLVQWLPDLRDPNPGDHFYVKYRAKGEQDYQVTPHEIHRDFVILREFDSCKNYELIVVSVDGQFQRESLTVVTPTVI